MKTLFTILLLLVARSVLSSEPPSYKVGDKLYSHAPNGLTLRKTPAKDGPKVVTVAFNAAPLTVLALPDPATRFAAETIGTFRVEGGWVKVRTTDGQEGYLFDGYLSTYPPSIEEPEEGIEAAGWFYQTVSPRKGKQKKLPPVNGSITHYQQDFTDGARYELQIYEGGSTQLLDVPASKFTMQDAYVLFKPVFLRDSKTTGTYDAAKKLLTISTDGGMTQLTIQPKGGTLRLIFMVAD